MSDTGFTDAAASGSQSAQAAAPGAMQLPGFAGFMHGVLATTAGKAVAIVVVIIAAIWLLKYVGEELT